LVKCEMCFAKIPITAKEPKEEKGMNSIRKMTAAVIALVMLLGAIPTAYAMNFWCPDEGLSHNWGATEWRGLCGTVVGYRYCKRCGAGEEVTNYVEHDWGAWRWCEGDEGTCVYQGSQLRICKRCGEGQDRSQYGDHEYGYNRVVERPTCTEKGKNIRNCKHCGKARYSYPDPLGHNYGAWILVKEPTIDEPGLMESVCSRCGDTLQKEVTLEDYNQQLEENNTYTTAIDVEIISDMSLLSGSLGDEIPVELKVTNIGETVVTLNSYMMHFENGDYADNDNRSEWISEDENISNSYFMPGEEMYATYTVKVTDADIERGEIIRKFTQHAREFYYPNGEVVRPGYEYTESETATLYVIYDSPSYDTVEIVIPLSDGYDFVEVEKFVESEPENGEYYTEGEIISFVIRLIIPEGLTIEEVKVYDHMPFGAEPVILGEMDTASAEDGRGLEFSFSHTVTEEDVFYGSISNIASAYFYDPEGDAYVDVYSDEVIVPTAPAPATPQDGVASLEKVLANAPANGEYYVLGETIRYELIFSSLVAHELHDVEIVDPLKGGNEDSVVTIEPVVDPYGVLSLSFNHVVTEEDVARGYVENTASAVWFNPEIEERGKVDSNTVVVSTTPGDFGMSDLVSVTKEVTSDPANGVCYVPGEIVSYTIAVKNETDDSLYHVDIIDLLDGSLIGQHDVIWADETVYAVFEYTVTDYDAFVGTVVNSAYVYGSDADGGEFTEFSNDVSIECAFSEDPFGIITGLEIEKVEESLPLNGEYYTLGEEISYKITYVNVGEIPLGEVIVYDSLAGIEDIASAEGLDVGESRYAYYKHTVTERDVERGYVANTAFAEYQINGYVNYAASETVYSDTNGIADEPAKDWPVFGVVDFGALGQGEDFCAHKLTERTASSEKAEVSFCAAHADMHEMVQTMLGFADDPVFLAQSYEYATLLWKQEVSKMYTELLKACEADARATVINEFTTFSVYAVNREAFLKVLYLENPEAAAKAVSDLWRDKLIDMCLELSTAPAKRADSLLAILNTDEAAGKGECLVCEENATEKGFDETQTYCPQHAFLFGMTDSFVNASAENGWNRLRQLWNIELTKSVNAASAGADDLVKTLLVMDNGMFASYLEARENLLKVLYPENPEIVSEEAVRMIMDHVNELCMLTK